jgi:hypothetical protein
MRLKFIGDWKELKPMGFTFHKLYASNYKVYEKNKVWIWVAHGGYGEVADFYHLSGYVVKAIWDGTFPVYEQDVDYGGQLAWLSKKKGDKRPCMINRKTGEIIERRAFTKKYCDKDQDYQYDYDLFRELSLYKETFQFIKDLKELNILEIKE